MPFDTDASNLAPRPTFPFTALVGQERMKTALLLNAINPRLGGVLIRGEKGSAKSTAVRALASLLPEVVAVAGCLYGCDPDDHDALCDDCSRRKRTGETFVRLRRQVRIVDLPVGATEDRVVGTLDLERAIQDGVRHFYPGLLARAHRGVLYVDEVNLLQDHLVDLLLDAAAMGRNYVEREGISLHHPSEFMLVGTMNPEEGDLRPQLLDRFALTVEVTGLPDPSQRADVVRRRIAFDRDPMAFVATWADSEAATREHIARARRQLHDVELSDDLLGLITEICAAFEVDGLRADIVMYRTAVTLAALAGRVQVVADDVHVAAELALPHRKRRQPFDSPELHGSRLDELMREHAERHRQEPDADGPKSNPPQGGSGSPSDSAQPSIAQPKEPTSANAPDNASDSATPRAGDGTVQDRPFPDRVVPPEPATAFRPAQNLTLAPRGPGQSSPGRRRADKASLGTRGAYAGSRVPRAAVRHLALSATIRAAAPYQRIRKGQDTSGLAVLLRNGDMRERVYVAKTHLLTLFVLDASGSMGAGSRMAATKGAIVSLLLDAYRKRDRVGLVVFRDDDARVILPFTNSVELAERLLATLPTGGRTPLARGLRVAEETLARAMRDAHGSVPLLVLLTDGRANDSATTHGDAVAEALKAAYSLAERIAGWNGRAVVIDTEDGRTRLAMASRVASALRASRVPLERLRQGGAASIWPARVPVKRSAFALGGHEAADTSGREASPLGASTMLSIQR